MPSWEDLEDVMKRLTLSVLILLAPLAGRADEVTPLGAKPGLWETAVTYQSSGMPAIPPEALARMPPEQRARIEAAMGAPHTAQSCMTGDSFKKPLAYGDNPNSSCKRTVTASTAGGMDFHVECDNGRVKSSGDGHVQAVSPESIKGETTMNTIVQGGRAMTSKISFTSRWLGPDCGSVKPK
jgi:Protein of unknown function (DUF3617)